jgi:predicted anti-sigma-YlaC factor YlaD
MDYCRHIRDQFDQRLEAMLDPNRLAAFDIHIASCSDCRLAWESYQAAWQLLARHKPIEPSVGFVERTLRRLDEPVHSRAPRLALRWLATAGAVIVISVAGLATYRHAQAQRRLSLYVEVQQADLLEDFDVIASLDQLNGGAHSL